MLGSLVGNNPMGTLDYTFNLIIEAQEEEAPPQEQQAPAIKIPPKIKSFINKLIKDFGPEGNKSMDLKTNRNIRDTLGISSSEVSKLMDKLKEEQGRTVEDLAASIAPNTDKL
ncbi:MAG: hypothetical protein H8D97_01010 [Proteobacteria bacterium]|nr:hypothetical protein [Pseudomonadota bacterium]